MNQARCSFRLLIAGLLAIGLAACGGKEPQDAAEPGKPAAVVTTAAPVKTAETTTETAPAEETVPEEVSETDDAPESPTTAGVLPSLRLAAVSSSDPKAPRSTFKEGVHYQRLNPVQPTGAGTDQVEVVEVFSFGCQACFALDARLERWRVNGKAAYVQFHRVPSIWNDTSAFHARVFYAAELLGKLEQLHTPIFREIHVNGDALNTMDKAKSLFTSQGVGAAEFDKTFASPALEAKLQSAGILNRRYRIAGVPTFVINGKFTADVQSAGGEEQLLQLVNELAAREHGGN